MKVTKILLVLALVAMTLVGFAACQSAPAASAPAAAPAAAPAKAAEVAGVGINIFSETARKVAANINKSEAASANGSATIDIHSKAVPALEGSEVIALDPGTGAWGGGFVQFDPIDASAAKSIVVSINTSALSAVPKSMEIKLEVGSTGNSFNLMAEKGVVNGAWTTYTVPLAQFVAGVGIGYGNAAFADLKALKSVGFWNPAVTGVLYVDDIHLE